MRRRIKETRKSLWLFRKFPHRIAGEYPEEWLIRILDALSVHVAERGLLSSVTEDREISLTLQYTADYLKAAKVALRETLDERLKQATARLVPPRAEILGELQYARERITKLEAENALLAKLVRAKTAGQLRVAAGTAAAVGQPLVTGTGQPTAARPSRLVVRSSIQTRAAERLAAEQAPRLSVSERLAALDSQDSSDTSAPCREASPVRRE